MTTRGHAPDTDQPVDDEKAVTFRVGEVVVDVIDIEALVQDVIAEFDEIDVTRSATT